MPKVLHNRDGPGTRPPAPRSACRSRWRTGRPGQPHHPIYNLGNHRSEKLTDFIAVLEKTLGKTTEKVYLPLQQGDVVETCADIQRAKADLDFSPTTPIEIGVPRFVDWYQSYYR